MKSLQQFLRDHYIFLIILFVLSLGSLFSLVHTGFMQTDDGNWMIIRFSAFYQALKDGEFPVRWLGRLNNGFGYPVPDFLYPGFLYIGVPVQIITSNVLLTIKILFGASLLASALGMYLWLSSTCNKYAGVVGSLVYLYLPYHLYDMTVRGSLGEILALAVVPFVFWFLKKGYYGLFSLFLALLILSHNTLAVLFVPVILIYGILLLRQKKVWRIFLSASLLGFGLSCFFWLPALYDLRYTVFSQIAVSDPGQYFAPFMLIGWTVVAVILASLISLFAGKRNGAKPEKVLHIIFFIIVAVVSLFFSIAASSAVWRALPVQFVQFPFRFLSVTVFATAFLSAWLVRRSIVTGIILVALTVVTGLPYLMPSSYQHYEEGYYTTNQATTTVKNEYMPPWVKQAPHDQVESLLSNQRLQVTDLRQSSKRVTFIVSVPDTQQISLHQIYFPGWEVLVDGKRVPVSYTNPYGLITFPVDKGRHSVTAQFVETPVRLFADILSLISLFLLIGFSVVRKKSYAKT